MAPLPIMSVSGIRGTVDGTFTRELAYSIAYLQTKYTGGGEIIVARDTRPSGELFAHAIFAGIRAAGGLPVDAGIIPTPTACHAVRHFGASGGIIITASHNPSHYNGYKMIHRSGRLFAGSECEEIYRNFRDGNYPNADEISSDMSYTVKTIDAVTPHINSILGEVDAAGIKKAGIYIAVDSINGAAGTVFPKLLSALGVKWIGVNNKIDGDFVHNPEPRPEHLTGLASLMQKNEGLWGGFVFDPDADRLALMGEHGEPLTEELTLILACSNILARKRTPVATNLSTSMMVDDVANAFGVEVIRTKIGEANVVDGLLKHGCAIGGEGNGGVIFPAVSIVRDGPAGMALILELMAKTGKTLTRLTSQWPSYPIIKEKISCENKNPQIIIDRLIGSFSNEKTDTQDGLKIIRSNGWVHVRPSNTEPIIRCYAEAKTQETARSLIDMIMNTLKEQGVLK
jgi:phosphomannomutase